MPPCVTGRRSSVRRTVTSVVSRIGIASTSSGSRTLVSVAPAVVQLEASASDASPKPITWLPESPMNTAAGRPGRRLNGRKPTHAPPSASATTSAEVSLVGRDRVDGEHRARDGGERGREPVHVVEQVEGVRDPDQPEQAERDGEHVRADELDRQARCEHDARRGELRRQLRERGQGVEVVEQAGDEEDRAAGEDAAELGAPVDDADGERRADTRHEPGEDADPAEHRRRPSCQRAPEGSATSRDPISRT